MAAHLTKNHFTTNNKDEMVKPPNKSKYEQCLVVYDMRYFDLQKYSGQMLDEMPHGFGYLKDNS